MLAWQVIGSVVGSSIFADGSVPVLDPRDMWLIGVAVGVVALLVVVGLVMHSRKGSQPVIDSCHGCGSMNVQHRAGLVVCMDCGYSEHAATA